MCNRICCLVFFLICFVGGRNVFGSGDLYTEDHDLDILINETKEVILHLHNYPDQISKVQLEVQHPDLMLIYPETLEIKPKNRTDPYKISIEGRQAGHSIITANLKTPGSGLNVVNAFIRVTVQHSYILNYFSFTIGWIYFFAWSISFYPQIYQNWKRKSVVGLNFDFLALNLLGFTLYAIFNIGLYYIPEIEQMYFQRHPRGTNPVQLNDVVFAVHAAFATIITIAQCYCYESGSQKVSVIARSLLGVFFVVIVVILGLSLYKCITWLDFLYYCSTIKLTITLIKYIPQAYMNYQRKSTIGWSIGNVLLDFTGGTLSMGQMLINAYNYDDWDSIFGDPTKFGLGLFSVTFDIFFIIQHYFLYRSSPFDYVCDIKREVSDPVLASIIYEEKAKMLKSDCPA